MWFPLAVPVWLFNFSLSLVVSKWILIGRCREGVMTIPSAAFIRWWWVDRAVHVWEQWVGVFFMGTPLLWVFCWLMGAKIHPSARIETFMREFDLVRIDGGAWLKSFSSASNAESLTMGRNCGLELFTWDQVA
jgi:hypothetical protein